MILKILYSMNHSKDLRNMGTNDMRDMIFKLLIIPRGFEDYRAKEIDDN